MPCSESEESKLARKRNKQIERELKKDFANFKQELKLLLLGTGESGKSTIIKQMRIIHGNGFNDEEREEFKTLVYRNLLRSAKAMLDATDALGVPLENKAMENKLFELCDIDENSYDSMAEHLDLYKALWADQGIQAVFVRSNEYQLSDSTAYFYSHLDRIAEPNYIPDVQDVLRARQPTTGIHEYFFVLDKAVFRMLDVGGQRSERRKWIHCFENVTSIIFIVASSEYDQRLVEDDTNRMLESIALFDQIITYPFFQKASFILFLNKTDLLAEKIKRSPIKRYFPLYEGAPDSLEDTKEFILDMYLEQKPDSMDVFPHYTTATDTKNVDRVFDAAKLTILRAHLHRYNLL